MASFLAKTTTSAMRTAMLCGRNTTSSAATKSWTQMLTTPNKVAQALDWKKSSSSLLCVNIEHNNTNNKKTTMDIAIASHPIYQEIQETPLCQSLTSIPLQFQVDQNRKVVSPTIGLSLQQLIVQYNVCGIIVSWPLVKQHGWCGAECGRVLHTLDQMTTTYIDRPICLYDSSHTPPPPIEDQWGRSEYYSSSSASTKGVVVSTDEAYYSSSTTNATRCQEQITTATHVAFEFLREYWPDYFVTQQPEQQQVYESEDEPRTATTNPYDWDYSLRRRGASSQRTTTSTMNHHHHTIRAAQPPQWYHHPQPTAMTNNLNHQAAMGYF